jgi:hypothetical protein
MDRMWLTRTDRIETITRGAMAGVIAGTLLGAFEMAGAVTAGEGWLHPWRMTSSIVLDRAAFTAGAEWALFTGILVHLTISVVSGVVAAMLYEWSAWSRLHHLGAPAVCAAGVVFGGVVWLTNFSMVAAAFLPWMWRIDQGAQFAYHLGYGAVLGLTLNALARHAQNPPDPVRA